MLYLEDGKRMSINEDGDTIEVTVYDEDGYEVNSVNFYADYLYNLLF